MSWKLNPGVVLTERNSGKGERKKESVMDAKRGRKGNNVDVDNSNYQPTKAELEGVVGALFPKDPPLVESGKGDQIKKEWEVWLKSRGV